MTRVLLAGVSTRDIAESAVRAGYEVVAVDGFGDLDLQACATEVRVVRVDGRFSARAAAAAARDVSCEAVVYEASFENHPSAVRALATNRMLWGNPPSVLARARDPRRLARVVGGAGLPSPRVRLTRPAPGTRSGWLVKPLRSGGGDGVAVWRGGAPVPRGSYLQERISGVTGSLVFAADGRRAVPLGLSRILAGETAFGADGFRYCGSILGSAGDPQFAADDRLLQRATLLAESVTRAFSLVGVNGVDFVARRGFPYAIEVNPRYTAAMELVERAYGISLFDVHARACRQALPAFDLAAARRRAPEAIGKAIVYARRTSALGDTRSWLSDPDVRDISPPGTRFAPREPICPILARGRDAAAFVAAIDSLAATAAPAVLAAQRRGRAGATLGEIRQRADLVVFWAVDPSGRYPRYGSRYAVEPRGVAAPQGRQSRALVAVDVGENLGPADANGRVAIAPGDEVDGLEIMRATVQGRAVGEDARFRPAVELARRMTGARYVVIVADGEPGLTLVDPARAEALVTLAQALNGPTRCALSTLRGGGNRSGADAVLTWQTGFPFAVDFARGYPSYQPQAGAATLLGGGDGDAALVVGTPATLPVSVATGLARVRSVVIGARASAATFQPAVTIDTGLAGVHEGGTAFRMDDVPLPLRPALEAPHGALVTVRALRERLRT